MSRQEEISAFLDGELSIEVQARLFETMAAQEALCEQWRCYQLIGDGLRQAQVELPLAMDLTARVMAQLASEPAWMLERATDAALPVQGAALPAQDVQRPAANQARWSQLSGLAAALSGVGVVAWLALSAPEAGESARALDARAPMTVATAQGSAQGSAQGGVTAVQQPEAATLALAEVPPVRLAVSTPATRTSESSAAPLEDAQAEHLRAYLVAHQTYATAHRFEGGAAYIRTVAAQR